ncbi:MAG: RAD55 family ATPase [Archaeoglobaceae archaeon]|nr:RAD55 family ATPase [Archaeoglobaceae archaeon]MDW8117825.1 RAD55 family ATPase [Archaeoglobaceae archaeon]
MKIYRTGIVPFDVQLEGGIPSGTVLLILEEPGAGGDVLSYHFAVEGANSGENVIYIATDDYEKDLKRFLSLYFDKYREFPILSFKKQQQENDVKGYIRKTGYDFLGRLKATIRNEKFNRIIINNLAFFFHKYSQEDVISLIESLSDVSKENESISVLLMTKGMLEERQETTIKHFCDGVIELSLRELENEIQRRLKFIKLEGVVVPRIVMRYEVTNKGIRMESTMRVL